MPADKKIRKHKYDYLVKFDFTTFHTGSRFVGRQGALEFSTDWLEEDFDMDEIKQVCANFVLREKPKWKIFMLDVKSVTKINNPDE